MAQLKDTIINGDLTVTGNIVGESIDAAVAPATQDTLGTVKGGGDVTINEGTITVNDDSHNHTISNVDDLQSALDGKLNTSGGTLTGNLLAIGYTITASIFNASSDRRLKENLSPYINENSILNLPIYKFDYIKGNKNQIGCMAQDLQEICPEIVNQGEDGYLSIQESKIIYLLLQEVKQLRKELDELKR